MVAASVEIAAHVTLATANEVHHMPLDAEILEPICVIVCISTHLIYKKHVFPFLE